MNKLTKEEYEFSITHLKTIEQIVVTSACSSISPEYLEGLKEINKKYKYTQCVTCNSSIFLATNFLYKDYIHSKEEYNKVKLKNNNENENKGRNKGNSKEKRKEGNDRKDQSITGESN